MLSAPDARPNLGKTLAQRAAILRSIRVFFDADDYLEVETPLLVPSPGLDLHLDAFEANGADGRRAGYLITSPEYQMKRLLSEGLPRIYQLARCFRAGEVGRRHNPEFSMLEWYTAHAGVEEMMAQTELLVRTLFAEHHCRGGETAAASSEAPGGCDVRQPFERITVAEAFERYAEISPARMFAMADDDEDAFFLALVDRVEPALATLARPVFLYDYPAPQASLARLRPHDARVAERFELYLGGWELCNGFGELTDAREQRLRLEHDDKLRRELNKPRYPIDERFLAALEHGMPAAAGNALGVDRLVALLLDQQDIDAVMSFSQTRL